MLSMFCGMPLSATSTTPRIRGKRCLLIWKLHKRLLLAWCGKGFANRRVRLLGLLKLMQMLSVLSRPKPALLVHDLDLLVDYFPGKAIDGRMNAEGVGSASPPKSLLILD